MITAREEDSPDNFGKNKTLSNLAEQLDAKIPREHVSNRSQGGKELSYLETWRVIDRLNKVFGHTNWSKETLLLHQVPGAEDSPFMAKVRITVNIPEENGFFKVCYREGFGYGTARKGTRMDYELAIKEAESDALKRAAMQFGMSLGLALYDKTQENVTDEEAEPAAIAKAEAPANSQNPKAVRNLIRATVTALDAKGKLSTDNFKKEYNVTKVDLLSDERANEILIALQTKYPEVKNG